MKALIVENAYIKNKSQISQADRIAEELRLLGVQVNVLRNFNLARIRQGRIEADGYDFCVFLDKDRVTSRLLEGSGLRLFNRSEAIEICDDKMLTSIALAKAEIRVPDGIYAPLCYYKGQKPDQNFLDEVAKNLGFPLVAKTNFGSLGEGVTLINSEEELYSYEEQNINLAHFYQRFIGCGGEDIRVIVVGGKYLCAMKRSNTTDFRSNIELGGKGEKYDIDDELKDLCAKTARVLNLDYCGIDALFDKDKKPYICEVNSNAFFAAAERVCGVNVAKTYAEYMVKTVAESAQK